MTIDAARICTDRPRLSAGFPGSAVIACWGSRAPRAFA
jgi:hypothetical protein